MFRDPPLSARLPLRLTQVYRASSGAQFFQQRLNTLNLAPADRDLLQPTLMRFGVMLAAHAPPPSLALLTRVLALANNLRADQVDRFARASLVRALADSSSLTEARDLEAA